MAVYHLNTQELCSFSSKLCAGDEVFLSGTVYTARDAAHKKIMQLINEGAPLPFEICGACIYYAGPTPSRPGMPIGSCGPTTSSRMDVFAPKLLDMGLCAMIGKGGRSEEVVNAIVRNGATYFCSIGGAGALAAMCIKKCEVVAFEELGCESVKRLEFSEFPVYTAIDCRGGSLFSN
ncbi:MAG: fumarate hydratase C-terminal domain-containing protein [Clostridia bacterium]|nr:fumarate hydratase C-terminal domain-containing protein [Clostridia bacterium]